MGDWYSGRSFSSVHERRLSPRPFITWLVLAALAAAPHLGFAHTSVRDSAGIRIVSNEPGLSPPVQVWHLGAEPELTIGAFDGPEEYVFPNITGGTILADGTIVLAISARGRTIGMGSFDRHGEHMVSVSRKGQGPGELKTLYDLFWLQGDSVMGIGVDLRFSIFDRRGEFVRTGRFGAPFPVVIGPMENQVFGARKAVWVPPEEVLQTGVHAPETAFLTTGMEGDAVDTLTVLPARRALHESIEGRSGRGVQVHPLPFSPDCGDGKETKRACP